MAKQRYISTAIWDDDWFVEELSHAEKLFYFYLLTNEHTNIAGIYKLSMRKIALETGFTQEEVSEVFDTLEKARKVYYRESHIIMVNWPKHQNWESSERIHKGLRSILIKEVPHSVLKAIQTENIPYTYPIHTLSRGINDLDISYTYPSNYLDSDSDSDSNLNTIAANSANSAASMDEYSPDSFPQNNESQDVKALQDYQEPEEPQDSDLKLFHQIQKAFLSQNGDTFTDFGKEGKAIKQLIAKSKKRDRENYQELIKAMIKRFWELKTNPRDKFWYQQPFLPSALNSAGIWDRVLETFREGNPDDDDGDYLDPEFAAMLQGATA